MTEYTALLALPNGEMARDASERMFGADRVDVIDNLQAGVWLTWVVTAEDDKAGIDLLQEIRLRAEMSSAFADPGALTSNGDQPSLFQATPFIILRGGAQVVHSEEVYCV